MCGLISVPERHERPHGPVITLAVAQFKSPNPAAAPDPLVLHHGGPGASNFEAFFPVLASPLGDALLARRDVVIIESRGLYHSTPNLVCEEVFEAQLDIVGKDIKGPEANGILLDAMRRSQARFVEEGIDLPAYNHVEMAADIDLVLTKLGYDRWCHHLPLGAAGLPCLGRPSTLPALFRARRSDRCFASGLRPRQQSIHRALAERARGEAVDRLPGEVERGDAVE